jgi:hypothetical protein
MEGVEGVLRSSEPEPCIDGHGYDKDKFGPVGVAFLEKDPCLLWGSICGLRAVGNGVGCH